jgi:hypothetical protein
MREMHQEAGHEASFGTTLADAVDAVQAHAQALLRGLESGSEDPAQLARLRDGLAQLKGRYRLFFPEGEATGETVTRAELDAAYARAEKAAAAALTDHARAEAAKLGDGAKRDAAPEATPTQAAAPRDEAAMAEARELGQKLLYKDEEGNGHYKAIVGLLQLASVTDDKRVQIYAIQRLADLSTNDTEDTDQAARTIAAIGKASSDPDVRIAAITAMLRKIPEVDPAEWDLSGTMITEAHALALNSPQNVVQAAVAAFTVSKERIDGYGDAFSGAIKSLRALLAAETQAEPPAPAPPAKAQDADAPAKASAPASAARSSFWGGLLSHLAPLLLALGLLHTPFPVLAIPAAVLGAAVLGTIAYREGRPGLGVLHMATFGGILAAVSCWNPGAGHPLDPAMIKAIVLTLSGLLYAAPVAFLMRAGGRAWTLVTGAVFALGLTGLLFHELILASARAIGLPV